MSEDVGAADEFESDISQIPGILASIGAASSAVGMSGSEGINLISAALGQMNVRCAAAVQDVMQLGTGTEKAFGPTAQQVLAGFAAGVKNAFDWLLNQYAGIETALTGIAAGFAAFQAGDTLEKISGAVGKFGNGLKNVNEVIGTFNEIGKAIKNLKDAKPGETFNVLKKAIQDLTGSDPKLLLISAAIAGIAALAFLIIKNWGPISGFFKKLWTEIKSGAATVGNAVKGAFTTAVNGLKSAWNGVAGFFTKLWNGIKSAAAAAWKAISKAVMAVVTPFVAAVQKPFNTLKTGLSNIMKGIQSVVSGAWNVIKNVVLGIILLFIDLITGDFKHLHTDLLGILNNLKNAFSTIWNGIKSVVTGIAQVLVGAIGKIFRGGTSVLQSIGNGLKSFFSGLWNSIKSTAVNLWNGLLGFFRGLPAKFSGLMRGVGDAVVHGFDSAVAFLKEMPNKMLQWGKDMIQGLLNGIKSMIGRVGDAIKGVGDKIRSFLHFSRPDEGPLADYETWMPDFMAGLAQGIESGKYKVVAAMRSLTSDLRVSMAFQPASAEAYGRTAVQETASAVRSARQLPAIDYHPTYTSPKALGHAEIARQSRQDAQRIALVYRRART